MSSYSILTPIFFVLFSFSHQAARRRMQEEAAERRRQESENRGIKDPEKVRRQQERAAQLERDELEAAKQGTGQANLRVSNIKNKIYY